MGKCERPCLAYGPALVAAVPITGVKVEVTLYLPLCNTCESWLKYDMIGAKLLVSSPGHVLRSAVIAERGVGLWLRG